MPIQAIPVPEPKLPVTLVADGKTVPVIGKVAALQGEAWIVRGGEKIAATAEAPLLKGDQVETADQSQISLVFADRSTFVLKDKGLIGLDDFAFDPATKTGSESILVSEGAFSYVSGDISKSHPGAARINTPAMNIGVRGTTVSGQVGADGSTSVALQTDPNSNFVGEIVLTRPGSDDAPLVISDSGSGVLGATLGSSFSVSNNAGSTLSSVVPAASAPPASAPNLPSAPASTGGDTTGTTGGGDGGTQNATPGGTGAGGDGGTGSDGGGGDGGDGGGGDVIGTVGDVPPLPVVAVVNTGTTESGATGTAGTGGTGGTTTGSGTTGGNGTNNNGGSTVVSNHAPVSAGLVLTSGTEDTSTSFTAADLLAAVSDADGDTLSITAVSADHGTVVDNGDGTYTLTPDADFFGTMTISYGVTDGTDTTTATASMDFANTPDAPVLGSATLANGSEDTPIVFTTAQLLGGANDADGDTLTITGISVSSGSGSIVDHGDGTFTYTPDPNASGAVTLSYSIDDGTGNAVPTSASFTVDAVNDAPILSTYVGMSSATEDVPSGGETVYALFNTGFSDAEDSVVTGVAVIGNNVVSPDGAWQYSTDGGTTWVDIGGVNDNTTALALSASTLLRFNAVADFNGTAPSLYVRGLDSSYAGAWSSSTGSPVYTDTSSPGGSSGIAADATELATDINAAPDAPTTSMVTLPTGVEDSPYSFTAADLLVNAVDVDDDILSVGNVSASVGTIVLDSVSGVYTLTLPPDYAGSVTLSYTISDGTGNSVSGTAITAIADAPDLGVQSGGLSFSVVQTVPASSSNDLMSVSADFNGDGLIDILTVNSVTGLALGINQGLNGGNAFDFTTLNALTGKFAVGDLDGDGDLDVVQINVAADNVVAYLNDGHGVFTQSDMIPRSYVQNLTIADINGDGHNDLIAVRSTNGGTDVYYGDGTGSFASTPDVSLANAAGGIRSMAGDIDGDGDIDLIVANWGANAQIYTNINGVLTETGSLSLSGIGDPATTGGMLGSVLIDLDGDGDLDVFAADRYVEGYWYENDGTGAFTRQQVDSVITERNGIVAGDFDGDGDLDLIIAGYNVNQVWRNDGGGAYTEVLAGSGLPTSGGLYVSAADYDGDGDLDLSYQNYLTGETVIYSNDLISSASYTEGGGDTSVFATLTVSDGDSPALTGAMVMIAANFGAGDVLGFTSYGGIVGNYDPGTGVLTLSGSATLADYQAVLRSVTFSNSTTTMTDGTRLITAVVTDGTSSSAPLSQAVQITLSNPAQATTAGTDALDGGGGSDTYNIAAGTFAAGDSITDSGTGPSDVDQIVMTGAGTTDLSVGTVSGIETLVMPSAGGTVILGGGADPLQFTSIVGGTGADTVIISSTVNLTGSDLAHFSSIETLKLADGSGMSQSLSLGTDGQSAAITTIDASASTGSLTIDASLRTSALNITAGSGNDSITGGTSGDYIYAGSGDDTVFSSAGDDVLDGQGGNNTLDYSGDAAGVSVDLSTGTATDGWGDSDSFSNFTNVVGSSHDDTLTAASAGGSTLTGGAGADTFVVNNTGSATITDFTVGTDNVTLSNASFGFGASGDLAVGDYAEGSATMTATATDYGGTGDGIVAIQNGSNVEVWSTTAMEAATNSNSHLVATLEGVNTASLDNTSFHLAV